MDWIFISLLSVFSALAYLLYRKRRSARLAYIKTYPFHTAIRNKISEKYPHLSEQDLSLVFRALRQYFWMCNIAGRKMVAMPSQVVDDAWHEFILFTRTYQIFCRKALGRFLHHTPTEAMRSPTIAQDSIKRAWRLACTNENISPSTPDKLPLIFAIDSLLNIPGGFHYSTNCKDSTSPAGNYCGAHIGCSAGCSGDSAATSDRGEFFDNIFDSSDGGGGGCSGGD